MLNYGERVLLSVSGGKDSLALALILALVKRRCRTGWDLQAAQAVWEEYPPTQEETKALGAYFETLEIPYTPVRASIYGGKPSEGFGCYTCSRNRRRILFEEAARREIRTIATGHHLDDFAETVLMNLTGQGRIQGMDPVRAYFNEEFRIIRPMIQIPEERLIRLTETFGLPVVDSGCPHRETNLRRRLRPPIAELAALNPGTREKIYRAFFP